MHVASLLIGSTVGAGGYLYISNLVSERNDRISGALVYKGLPTSQTAFGSLTSAVYAKAKELPKTESELGAKLRSTWNGAIFSVKDSISSLIADAKKK